MMQPTEKASGGESTVTGIVAAISMMAGAVGGGMLLPAEQAGLGTVALCVAVGAVGGWAAGYLSIRSLGFVFGRKVLGVGYRLALLVLLAILGGVAGYWMSGGRLVFAGLGALILGLPNLLLMIAYFGRSSDAQPEQPDASEAEEQLHWPLWQRCLCFLSALVVIGWGGHAALTQTFYLNRGSSSSGIEVTGIAAVMIGLVLASFGTVFLLYCVFPKHKIWTLGAQKQGQQQEE